jgi:hypothetical protein
MRQASKRVPDSAEKKLPDIERLLSQLQIACGFETDNAGTCDLFDTLLEAMSAIGETEWDEDEPNLIPVMAQHIRDAVLMDEADRVAWMRGDYPWRRRLS